MTQPLLPMHTFQWPEQVAAIFCFQFADHLTMCSWYSGRALLQRADVHLQPHADEEATIIRTPFSVYSSHNAAFTHSAAGLKLRDEFEAVSDRQSQTRGEIIMHSSRTQWAYSFYDTLCLCVCVCCLSTSVTASQPPLPEAAVPHHGFTSLFSSSHSLLHFLFQRLGCGFWTTHPFSLSSSLIFPHSSCISSSPLPQQGQPPRSVPQGPL